MKEREFKRKTASPLRGLAVLTFFVIFTLITVQPKLCAQWRSVLSFSSKIRVAKDSALWQQLNRFTDIYFLNEAGFPNIGFATTNFGDLFKTTDGGLMWSQVDVYPLGDSRDMVFKDRDTGWIAIFDLAHDSLLLRDGWTGCLKTTNGGESWEALNGFQASFCPSIYFNNKDGGLFMSAWLPHGWVSWDEGATWATDPAFNGYQNGFSAFNQDTIILSTVGTPPLSTGPPNWLRTTNGGNTWDSIAMDSESFQPLAIPGTKTGFAILDFSATVVRTDDLWNTWHPIFSFPSIPDVAGSGSSGCIRGDSCRLFLQVASGCYMSTDEGQSWVLLGGISSIDFADSRFWADKDKVIIGSVDTSDGYSYENLWRLNIGYFISDYYGVSERLDNGTQQTTLHPGDSVGVTFVPGAGTLAATDSVTLTLRWDGDAVSLASLRVPSGWWISDSSRVGRASSPTSGMAEILTITLRSDSAQSLPDPLLHAEFQTYLTPSEQSQAGSPTYAGSAPYATYIYLDSAQSFFPQTTPCAPTVLSLQQSDSVELDFTGCGDSLLEASMLHEPPFTIESVVPNPATASLRVQGIGCGVQGFEVQMFDDLGNCVLDQRPNAAQDPSTSSGQAPRGTSLRSDYTLNPTPYTLTLDVSSLPSGIYFLRLSNGSYAVSRSVAIER